MDGLNMPADMTLYFDVIKQIQDQINRITYANQLNEQERLNQLNRLEHEISQKFQWARRSIDTAETHMVEKSQDENRAKELTSEMDVA
jgi:hypothetical protein